MRTSDAGAGEVISVLIADDHTLLSESLRTALDAEPDITTVGVAGTLRETQEMLTRTAPDVLVLDHRMPDGEGISAIASFKRRHPDTAIVVVTASAGDQILLRAIEAGAAGFVSKTDGLTELTSSVRSAALGEAVISHELLAGLLTRLKHRRTHPRPGLTARESEVLQLVGRGMTNAEIARELVVSVNTVRNHIANISTKLGARSKLETLVIATRQGILDTGLDDF
jgi:DNA-binding NarL/FixJ family response regulator